VTDHDDVVDAEVVEGELLPAVRENSPVVVDRHTVLYPGQEPPRKDEQPRYTERDLYVSQPTAERLENHSAPANTRRAYGSQRKQFAAWCTEHGRVAQPCTTATFVEYVAHMIEKEYSPNAISVAMSAIRTWMPEDKRPGTRQARGMLNEYRKAWGRRNIVRKAPAITDAMMRAMVATCDLRTPAGLRDRCVLLLGRGALNRRIELADLSIADVAVDDDFVTLHIRSSKTDQAGQGEHTDIPADPDPLLDPVHAVRDWLQMLYRLGRQEGPFLRALTSRGTLQNRSRATVRGDYVSGDAVNSWIRNRAYLAKIPNWQDITAHGLRRGGAQEIADAGGDPTKQGRWKPGSAVVKREYLDRAQSRSENPWLRVQARRAANAPQPPS
jgi:integrase